MAGPGGREVGRVSIRVVPNTEKFRERLQKSLKKETKGLNVEIPVKLKGIKKAQAELNALSRNRTVDITARVKTVGGDKLDTQKTAKLKVIPEVDTKKLDKILEDKTAKLKVSIDTAKAKAEMKKLETKGHAKIDVDVDTTKAKAKLKFLERIRTIKIRIQESKFGKVASALKFWGKSAEQAQGYTSGLSKETIYLIAAVIILLPLIVGLAATLIAAIPSLLAFGGALAAITYLGWDGIKKAAEAVTPAIERLKETVSDTFESKLTPVFEAFGQTIDKLGPGVNKVAGSMADAFARMSSVINSPDGIKALDNILGNISKLMDQLGPVMEKGMAGFLGLANLASESFGRLGNTISVFTDKFYDFVNGLAQSGRLDKAFEGLETALNGLSEGFFMLMDAGIDSMAAVGDSVGKFFESFGNFAQAAMPILSSVLNVILNLASTLMDALSPALVALQPAFERLAEGFATILKTSGPQLAKIFTAIAEIISGSLMAAMDALAPVLPVITDAFVQMTDVLAQMFVDMGPTIIETIGLLAEAFAEITVILAPLLPKFAELAGVLITAILPILPELARLFTQIALYVLPPLAEGLSIVADLLIAAEPLWRGLGEAIAWCIRVLTRVIAEINKFVGWLKTSQNKVEEFRGFFRNTWESIKDHFSNTIESIRNKMREKLEEIKQNIKQKGEEFVEALKSTVPGWVKAGIDVVLGFIRGLKQKFHEALDMVKGWANKIKSVFTNALDIFSPSREFQRYGVFISQGLEKGIKESEDKPITATKDMATRLKEAAQKEFQDFPKELGKSLASTFASDLGFSSGGAIGTLMQQLMDPTVRWEEEQNVYIVKDVEEAERHSNNKKKKKSLQYKTPGMRRG